MKVMLMRRLLLPLRQAAQPACAGCRPETTDGGLWTLLLHPSPRRHPSLRHCHLCLRLKAHAAKGVGKDEKSGSCKRLALWSGGGVSAGCCAVPARRWLGAPLSTRGQHADSEIVRQRRSAVTACGLSSRSTHILLPRPPRLSAALSSDCPAGGLIDRIVCAMARSPRVGIVRLTASVT